MHKMKSRYMRLLLLLSDLLIIPLQRSHQTAHSVLPVEIVIEYTHDNTVIALPSKSNFPYTQ